jgi:hypothetical protein
MLTPTVPGGRFFTGPSARVRTVTEASAKFVARTCAGVDDIIAMAKPANMAVPKNRVIIVPEPPEAGARRCGALPVAPRVAPKSTQAINAATEARGPRRYIITVACMGSAG